MPLNINMFRLRN